MTVSPVKTAILGGSFNPPHIAHQLVTLWVLETQEIDEVWWVPTYQHYLGKELLDFSHRLRMCEIATKPFGARVFVSSVEQERGGVSRMLDTLEQLTKTNDDREFRLVVGADILTQTEQWYRWDEIAALAPPIIVGREGYDSDRLFNMPAISSTEIRARLRDGKPVSELVSAAVLRYIAGEHLYGT